MADRGALTALVLACSVSLGAGAFAGCGPDAVGIDACRRIEQARCEAAVVCGVVSDVDGCRRFYRDQCLHGLAAAEAPGEPAVRRCVAAIEAAASCESDEPGTPLDECPDGAPATPLGSASVEVPCDVVLDPEAVQECDFLASDGSAGARGNAGSAGAAGTGGSGGSSG